MRMNRVCQFLDPPEKDYVPDALTSCSRDTCMIIPSAGGEELLKNISGLNKTIKIIKEIEKMN